MRGDSPGTSSITPLLDETSFIDGDSEDKYSTLMESAKITLADVFNIPKYGADYICQILIAKYIHIGRERQTELLHDSEKIAILKMESRFLQNWADLFLLLIDSLATNLVNSEHADGNWKVKLLESCQTIINEAQRRHKSKAVAELEVSTETKVQEMLGFDIVRSLF